MRFQWKPGGFSIQSGNGVWEAGLTGLNSFLADNERKRGASWLAGAATKVVGGFSIGAVATGAKMTTL